MERKLKVNINQDSLITSNILVGKNADLLIAEKKIGDKICYNSVDYIITGATSSNGSFHKEGVEVRGREFIEGRKRKIMVESMYLDDKTNQIFLVRI